MSLHRGVNVVQQSSTLSGTTNKCVYVIRFCEVPTRRSRSNKQPIHDGSTKCYGWFLIEKTCCYVDGNQDVSWIQTANPASLETDLAHDSNRQTWISTTTNHNPHAIDETRNSSKKAGKPNRARKGSPAMRSMFRWAAPLATSLICDECVSDG